MTGMTGLFLLLGPGCERDSKLTTLRRPGDTAVFDTGDTPPPIPPDDTDTGNAPCPTHRLIVLPRDVWAAPLTVDWNVEAPEDWWPAPFPWDGGRMTDLGSDSQLLLVELDAADHRPLSLGINHDGTSNVEAVTLDEIYAGAATTAFTRIDDCPTTILFAGLGHAYFADSAPVPTRNSIELLFDGEDFWEAVAEDIADAEERISWSAWWWDSTFELIRSSDPSLDEDDRYPNTVTGLFNANTYVDKRILVNRFWGESNDWFSLLYTDDILLNFAEQPADFFEFLLVGNETDVPITGELPDPDPQFSFTERIRSVEGYADLDFVVRDDQNDRDVIDVPIYAASWHQKSIVFDGKIGYVSGFNTKQTDWDTRNHGLFDPRRTEYDASESEREEIIDLEEVAPLEPRADYGLRVEGPLVHDLERYFSERWQAALDDGVSYSENATSLPPLERRPEVPDGVLAQMNVTTPDGDASIYESHKNAIEQATDYVFIEDQYFRAPILNDAIYERMIDEPDLVLIVVTMPVDEYDPALKYTYLSHEMFADDFPDRYLPLQLRNDSLILRDNLFFDEVDYYNEPIFVHSKLRMIDDRYLSVGSCNMNNRGYKYEGEMNLSVLDDAFVSAARAEIFADMVGEYASYLSDDPQNNFDVLRMVSQENRIMADWWADQGEELSIDDALDEWVVYRPSGFVYPLDFSEDYLDVAGPDLF